MTTISFSANIYLRLNQGTIQYSLDNTSYSTISSWPCTLTNISDTNKTVYITNNLEITTINNMYFTIGSSNITIDGQNNTININSVTNYPGLVQNGKPPTNGFNNIIIKNLGVTSSKSTLSSYGGWVGHAYMNNSTNSCEVINCYSTGTIENFSCGGIFGSYSRGTATNCYSSGDISGSNASGIFGYLSDCIATNCYSSGAISGRTASGIFGSFSTGTATNCYSSGAISGRNASGIFGVLSIGTATNYYIADGKWNDQTAIANLIGTPAYSGSALIQQGSVWIDVNTNSSAVPFQLKSFNNTALYFTNFTLETLFIDERSHYWGSLTSDSITQPQYKILSQPIDNLYISGNSLIAKYPFYYREYQIYPVEISGTVSDITIVRSFNIQIGNLPDTPIIVYISNNNIPANSPIGTIVGTLTTYDHDPNDTFTYQFSSGSGSTDNTHFTILGNTIYTSIVLNYNTKNSYNIRVKSTDSNGLSVENPIILNVILPIAGSFQISGLIGSSTTIQLRGKNITGGSLLYQITQPPKNGYLTVVNTDSIYTYVPFTNIGDSFEYVVMEGTMTSLPGKVIITNYNQSDIQNIPKKLGTYNFDNISFDGNKWIFGTITTDTFIQDSSFYKLGNYELTK